jgi:acetylornithine deacetylase/succinyl-diaminopimelate desuccinylase-like protein
VRAADVAHGCGTDAAYQPARPARGPDDARRRARYGGGWARLPDAAGYGGGWAGPADPLAADLAALVAIPSVSSPAPARDALAAAAGWLARRLAGLGAHRVAVRWVAGAPVVLAERRGPPGAPTVLAYGHFDVVAPGPRRSWSAPPFRAVRRDGVLFGRGAADDKGPVLAQLQAARDGAAVGWKFVYDGAEEIGSPGLTRLLPGLAGWLADVDAVLVCDTEATAGGRPTVTCSLRGQLTVELTTRGAGRPLHAGRYGGAVPNPAQALAHLVASLHRPDGRVAINGFVGDVRPVPPLGAAELDRRLAPLARPGWGEPGRRPAEQVTGWPALVVTALCAGDCGAGPWHSIPAEARAKINVRLVPDQRPAVVFRQLAAHLARHAPPGITVGLRRLVGTRPWAAGSLDGPAARAAAAAVREVWGRAPALVRSGGTVPAVPLLARALPRAEILLLGFTLPGDGAHAPDEHVELARLRAAADTVTRFTERLAEAAP